MAARRIEAVEAHLRCSAGGGRAAGAAAGAPKTVTVRSGTARAQVRVCAGESAAALRECVAAALGVPAASVARLRDATGCHVPLGHSSVRDGEEYSVEAEAPRGPPLPAPPGRRRRFVDISIPLENGVKSDPPGSTPDIQYITHKQSAKSVCAFFPGLKPEQLPDGEGWAVEVVKLNTHNGTHLDAPYHFASTMDNGKRAITIDEVPLDWCLAPGVKLDLRHFESGHVITAAEMEEALRATGHDLAPGDIVLVNTRAGARYGKEDYIHSGCGLGHDATMFLLDRGIRVTGTDGWSWDAPFSHTAKRFAQSKDPGIIWEGHKAGRERGYCHLEKLHNLEALPPKGFFVACFPHKIRGASAGWTRAVAIIDE